MTRTDTTQPGERPLKVDQLGRVRTTAEERETILDRFEQSAMPGTRFAAMHGIKYQTFAGWVQKRRRQREGRREHSGLDDAREDEAAQQKPRWALAEMMVGVDESGQSSMAGPLWIELPGGGRMEVRETGQVPLAAALLKALCSQRPC